MGSLAQTDPDCCKSQCLYGMFMCVFVVLGQSPHTGCMRRVVQQLLVPFFSLLSWKLLMLLLQNNEKMTPRATCLGLRCGGNGNKFPGDWE